MTKETQEIINRTEAKARNLKTYFTGEPCKRGHVAVRLINGTCTECTPVHKQTHKDRMNATDPEAAKRAVNEAVKRHYVRNRAAILAKKATFYQDNAERLKAASKARRDAKKAQKQANPVGAN